jgi:DNA ligase-associated metallophosphoesterase
MRLSDVLHRTGPSRLVILGDLWHDLKGRTAEVERKLCDWKEQWPGLEILLVTGNHDVRTGRRTSTCGIVERESMALGPFVCRHHPEPAREGYVLCGHVHPAVRLEGRGLQALRLPCFWFGAEVGVLPAFGEMTGTATIEPERDDRVLAVVEDSVIPVWPA